MRAAAASRPSWRKLEAVLVASLPGSAAADHSN